MLGAGILLSLTSFHAVQTSETRVLVFSKTAGFRHSSIPAGKAAIMKIALENGFKADTTENENYFNDDSLRNYQAVIFLNTTGNVLNSPQQTAFERYIQAGGGYVGVHAAADTEYDWPWYGRLTGGYFLSHPQIQAAVVRVSDRTHPGSSHLPEEWQRTDEWYNYKHLNPDIRVLANLDEGSYQGGANGSNHPIAWYHPYDGGRAFYTGMGHTEESYTDPLYLKHLLGGITYAMGNNIALDYSKATTAKVPEENRFVRTVLTEGTLFEPTEIAVLPNLDILIAQRRGEILLYKNKTGSLSEAALLDVYSKTSVPGVNAEEGVLGIAADPEFSKNNYVYIYYSPADTSVNRLSRFKLISDKIDQSSEKIIIEVYSQREICCHTGGSIAFGPDGLLYLSTGDNSTPFDVPRQEFVNKGYGPMDNRPGLEQYDARRSSGNSNDLRGKILRIRVMPDGSYEIPEGNLFSPGTPKTRPEIYVMGNRNPYRISIDRKSNFLYWGEVGPDANADSPERGPRGYDEVNQARKAGFFGWPFFVGNNYAYRQYDYKTGSSGNYFDPEKPVNNSENNTGIEVLPPVSPAFIWYPYAESKEFPQLGTGGRNAEAGPVYHSEFFPEETRYPDYYNDKLFIYDWIRGWIKAVSMKPNGDYDSMESFMGTSSFAAPIDMEAGPDGRLYILEYGKGWFTKNPDAALIRIDYIAGNRPPKIESLTIRNTSGLLPYRLQAEVKATDPDNDPVSYTWNFGDGVRRSGGQASVDYVYTQAGEYPVSVEITDSHNVSTSSTETMVYAGNAQPKVAIAIKGNKTFYFAGKPIDYQVTVQDEGAAVNHANIYVSDSYIKGSDLAAVSPGHAGVSEIMTGQALMLKSDCQVCHNLKETSIGPAYTRVAEKYRKDPSAPAYLSTKIIGGSSGVWGEVAMPAHPTMPESDARKIAQYILSLGQTNAVKPSLPANGQIIPEDSAAAESTTFVLTAVYTDQGTADVRPLSDTKSTSLRSNYIPVRELTERTRLSFRDSTATGLISFPQNNGWLKLSSIDLQGIGSITLNSINGAGTGTFIAEVRIDQEDGALLGQTEIHAGGDQKQLNSVIAIQKPADTKLHDVYILIRSPGALRGRPLLQSLKFNPI
jgi:cytochrome c